MEEILYNAQQIQELLPHRYPFLLIDKIIEMKHYERVVAIKNVSINEPYFQGHFPGLPVVPGVLQLEAMAQASAVLAQFSLKDELIGKTIMLCGATDVKWKRQVVPGDTLRIEMNFVKRRKPLFVMQGTASVDGLICCSGTITAAEVG